MRPDEFHPGEPVLCWFQDSGGWYPGRVIGGGDPDHVQVEMDWHPTSYLVMAWRPEDLQPWPDPFAACRMVAARIEALAAGRETCEVPPDAGDLADLGLRALGRYLQALLDPQCPTAAP